MLRHVIIRLTVKNSKILTFSLTAALIFLGSCAGGGRSENKKAAMLIYSDSLFQQHKAVRSLFRFKLDVIAERKKEMRAQLQSLRFAKETDLSESEKSDAVRYEAIYRVYRDIIEQYAKAVLFAEELFYNIKGLEGQIKNGFYSDQLDAKKLNQFKKEYGLLRTSLNQNQEEARFIDRQLTAVEPGYQTLAPKIDALLEKLGYPNKETANN